MCFIKPVRINETEGLTPLILNYTLGLKLERLAPEAAQRFEIQMSTLVLFISREHLLRKVVASFQKA